MSLSALLEKYYIFFVIRSLDMGRYKPIKGD